MTKAEIKRRWYHNMSPERKADHLAKQRAYRKAHPPDPETARKWTLKSRYDLSLEEFNSMLAEQGNSCKICLKPQEEFHVDHDHKTDKVRGILCQKCNMLLGLAGDDPEILIAAIDYLKKSWN